MDPRIDLCKRSQTGDREAFGDLYALYAKELYRYAYFVLGSPELAADAVQDAVISAFEQIKSLRKPEAFKAWLFKILSNTCKKHLGEKIRQRNTLVYDENIAPLVLAQSPAQDDFLDLKRAFEILSPDQRQIVALCVAEGYKSREVAEILGVRPGTVRSKLSRALQKMREELTAY
jgi:RNA polymerase sigma-70 factor (ECF subfamily)